MGAAGNADDLAFAEGVRLRLRDEHFDAARDGPQVAAFERRELGAGQRAGEPDEQQRKIAAVVVSRSRWAR
jgi:hypothetical protein